MKLLELLNEAYANTSAAMKYVKGLGLAIKGNKPYYVEDGQIAFELDMPLAVAVEKLDALTNDDDPDKGKLTAGQAYMLKREEIYQYADNSGVDWNRAVTLKQDAMKKVLIILSNHEA